MSTHPINEARVNPEGFIAQRITQINDTALCWFLLDLDPNGQLRLTALDDEAVADWPPLGVKR